MLPFVVPRIFRPTYLETFQMTNMELGTCFSSYGIVALVSYLLGGFLADRFPPGKLMGVGLVLTALGGWYASTFPSITQMHVLYSYWGVTTILMFWAALIKATRIWGGAHRQGRAFGFLDGGRGLVSALFGSLGILVISFVATEDLEAYATIEKQEVFSTVIRTFSVLVGAIGVLSFFTIRAHDVSNGQQKLTINGVKEILSYPAVYLIAVIIVTGYAGYKTSDIFSQYANEVMLYSEKASAGVGTLLLYLRPALGILVGFVADASRPSRVLMIGFAAMGIGALMIASGFLGPSLLVWFYVSIITTGVGIYAIRSLYFAVLAETDIPVWLTGTAVGFVSILGYTPDIFMGPVMGYFLDGYPGQQGYSYLFYMVALLSVIGMVSSYLVLRRHRA